MHRFVMARPLDGLRATQREAPEAVTIGVAPGAPSVSRERRCKEFLFWKSAHVLRAFPCAPWGWLSAHLRGPLRVAEVWSPAVEATLFGETPRASARRQALRLPRRHCSISCNDWSCSPGMLWPSSSHTTSLPCTCHRRIRLCTAKSDDCDRKIHLWPCARQSG